MISLDHFDGLPIPTTLIGEGLSGCIGTGDSDFVLALNHVRLQFNNDHDIVPQLS